MLSINWALPIQCSLIVATSFFGLPANDHDVAIEHEGVRVLWLASKQAVQKAGGEYIAVGPKRQGGCRKQGARIVRIEP